MTQLINAYCQFCICISLLLMPWVHGQGVSRAGLERLRDVTTGTRWLPRAWDEFLADLHREFSRESLQEFRLDRPTISIQAIILTPKEDKKDQNSEGVEGETYQNSHGPEEMKKIPTSIRQYEVLLLQSLDYQNQYRRITVRYSMPQKPAQVSRGTIMSKEFLDTMFDFGSGPIKSFSYQKLRLQHPAIGPEDALEIARNLVKQRPRAGPTIEIYSIQLLLSGARIGDKIPPSTFYYQITLQYIQNADRSKMRNIYIPLSGDRNNLILPWRHETPSASQQRPCIVWPCRVS